MEKAAEPSATASRRRRAKRCNRVVSPLSEFVGPTRTARGCEELRQILQYAGGGGVGQRVRLDPSLARGFPITGAIRDQRARPRRLLGGAGAMTPRDVSGREVPACGSAGAERIIVVMTSAGVPRELTGRPPLFGDPWGRRVVEAHSAGAGARGQGLRWSVTGGEKMGKQLVRLGARVTFVVVAGPTSAVAARFR